MDILDNANVIKQRDSTDMLGAAVSLPAQLRHDFGLPHQKDEVSAVVLLTSEPGLSLDWLQPHKPCAISQDAQLPSYVDSRTLVIFVGDNHALREARERHAKVAVVSEDETAIKSLLAGELGVCIPGAFPTMNTFYYHRALAEIAVAFGLAGRDVLRELSRAADVFDGLVSNWLPDVPLAENSAKQLARDIAGKTAIIYSGAHMQPAAKQWKLSINTIAKNTAWETSNSSDEVAGWTSHPVYKQFAVIDLVSSFESDQVVAGFTAVDRLLSGVRPKAYRVEASGDSILEHMFYLALYGCFVAIYLGILNGVELGASSTAKKYKKEIG